MNAKAEDQCGLHLAAQRLVGMARLRAPGDRHVQALANRLGELVQTTPITQHREGIDPVSTFSPEVTVLLRGEQIASRLDLALRQHGILFPSLRADPGIDDQPHVYAGGFTGQDGRRLIAVLEYAGVKLAEDRQSALEAESRLSPPAVGA